MEIKFELGEVEIPKSIEEKYKKDTEKNDISNINDYIDEIIGDLYFDKKNKICEKDLAEFLIAYINMDPPFDGGYPVEEWMIFDDNGFKYSICAHGWTSEIEYNKGSLNMIGYKEKIKFKEG